MFGPEKSKSNINDTNNRNNENNQMEKSNLYVYILELEHGKYYVGKTTNPNVRFQSHVTGNGSEWTKLHKPIKVLEQYQNCDEYDEDKYLFKAMEKYGIDNVRGGSFVQIKLNETELNFLNKRIISATNKCFICESPDHFVKDCPIKQQKTNQPNVSNFKCYECGSLDHFIKDCPIRIQKIRQTPGSLIHAAYIDDQIEKQRYKAKYYCSICKKFSHNTENCFNKPKDENIKISNIVVCYICKSSGHYASACPNKKF